MSLKIRYALFIVLSLLWMGSISLHAEQAKMPPFRITQTNGHVFNAKDLPGGKPTILIYFSPDCGECLEFMDSFFPKIHHFDTANIVMINAMSMQEMIAFADRYNVKQYSNVVVGTEAPRLTIWNYLQISALPYLALYDKDGNEVCSYQQSIPLDDVITLLKRLK
ncbi:TlpA family protein disulfide reductase [Microbacter margulisiae]|uniref:Thiol-disulfide isomerase/thioredoxin n=1 Tax=Microbacter margulisiae TaxID=1350067 RepID=A0A7W5H1I0_9PORP|nr:redoxin domain-containing protein [Microbacter margulisiae]MBB3186649.1 thiol-disulfide isomerase/thioredoxin [Microbacter margulisiae]